MATKTMEKRVSDLEEMVEDVPRLINLRFSFIRAQLDAPDARISTIDAKVDRLANRVEALPRVLAEMLDERENRGR